MNYNKPLPHVHQLLSLATTIQFPATRKEIEQAAESQGLTSTVTDFLNLYPADEIFDSKVDFMTRSEELEMFINQEREMPQEILRSPQD